MGRGAWRHGWRRAKACASWALGTHGGVRRCRVMDANGALYLIESDMGVPQVTARTVVLLYVGPVQGAEAEMGNPHSWCSWRAGRATTILARWDEVAGLGAKISVSPAFVKGTNVEFCAGAVDAGGCVPDL